MFEINKQIITKKPHACGSYEWIIIRTGADYKLKCKNCGRIILVDLNKLEKMVKK